MCDGEEEGVREGIFEEKQKIQIKIDVHANFFNNEFLIVTKFYNSNFFFFKLNLTVFKNSNFLE